MDGWQLSVAVQRTKKSKSGIEFSKIKGNKNYEMLDFSNFWGVHWQNTGKNIGNVNSVQHNIFKYYIQAHFQLLT